MATSLPCLVFDSGDDQCATQYSLSDGALRPCGIDAMRTKRNWPTALGWVLAWDPATSATFLWNPHAPAIALPSLPQPVPVYSDCTLSRSPTHPDGFTAVLVEPPEGAGGLWYCHAGGGGASAAAEWVRHEYDLGCRRIVDEDDLVKTYVHDLVASRGRFYWPLPQNEYGVLEFSPEPVMSTVEISGVQPTCPDGQSEEEKAAGGSGYAVDLDGEVHEVLVCWPPMEEGTVIDVAVYRMDLSDGRSVRVDSIGDRAILVGCDFAGWCPAAESGLLPNSVYWLSPHDKCLHVFDIGANTEEVRQDCKAVAELARQVFLLIPPVHP